MLLSPRTTENETVQVTVEQIGLAPFVKWQTLGFLVMGVLAGLLYSGWAALANRTFTSSLIWYSLVTTVSYVILGVVSSTILGVLYNSLAARFGGMRFVVVTQHSPPPPPPPERWEGTLPKINEPDSRGRA
jgi:ABC-type Fe3+ transport system permease subunit